MIERRLTELQVELPPVGPQRGHFVPCVQSGNLLFVSAEYDAGAKVIELQRKGLQTTATEVWSSNRLRLHHWVGCRSIR